MRSEASQLEIGFPKKKEFSPEQKAEIYELLYTPDGETTELRTELEKKFGPLRSEYRATIQKTIKGLNEYFGEGFCEYGETKMRPYVSYVVIKKFRPDIEKLVEGYQKMRNAA